MTKQKAKTIEFTFQSKIEIIDIGKLKVNAKNPRLITRIEFERLKENIKANPNMLMIRPIVYDTGGKVIAGNQRFRACVELGLKKIPAINVSKLTKKEKDNFLLWDNESAGKWDYEELATWGNLYGIELPQGNDVHKFTDANAEMPIIPMFDEKYRAFLIVVENEMDFSNLLTRLNIGRMKSYKSSATYPRTQVISYEQFQKLLNNENSNSEPQKA